MNTVIRVAYAEDHQATRIGMQTILDSYEEISLDLLASNGREMIKLLEQADVLPDVCIIDINMPVMDGFQLQEEIRRRWPELRSLVYTMYNNEPFIVKMIAMGSNGYLLKSAEPDEIVEAIKSIHDHGFYYSNVIDRKKVIAVQNNKIRLPQFLPAEIELLRLANSDMSYAEIALKLNTTTKSIEGTRDRLFNKLNIKSRVGLAMYAVQHGYAIL